MKIPFSERISIQGLNISDINSSNTEIKILPYIDPSTENIVDLSKYNLTWNATKFTEQEIEIQLEFENPDQISRNKIYDQIQVSFNTSYEYFIIKNTNKVLDESSRLLRREIPPQDKKTHMNEVLKIIQDSTTTSLWFLNIIGALF